MAGNGFNRQQQKAGAGGACGVIRRVHCASPTYYEVLPSSHAGEVHIQGPYLETWIPAFPGSAEGLRFAAFACKKRQIEATGAEALVTACGNCRKVLEEAIEHDGMTLPVLGLTELVAQHLDEPREKAP